MVQFVEERARERGLETLIALSTQAFNFFRSKAGFGEGGPDDLPPDRRERYEQSGRRSKVLVKALRPDPARGSARGDPQGFAAGSRGQRPAVVDEGAPQDRLLDPAREAVAA